MLQQIHTSVLQTAVAEEMMRPVGRHLHHQSIRLSLIC